MNKEPLQDILQGWIERFGDRFGEDSFNIHFEKRQSALAELLIILKEQQFTIDDLIPGLMDIVECCIPEPKARKKAGYGYVWVKSLCQDLYLFLLEFGLQSDETFVETLIAKVGKKTGVKIFDNKNPKKGSKRPVEKKPKKFSGERLLDPEEPILAIVKPTYESRDKLISKVMEELPPATTIPEDADDILLGDSEEGLAFEKLLKDTFLVGDSDRGEG